ncbi:MAG: serine hydrolase domain-containing protein, partial [Bacteroidota bacterium]
MKQITLKIIGLSLLYLLGMQYAFAQKANPKSQIVTSAQIDEVFQAWDDPNKPGMSVAVIQGESIVYTKGFGSANLEYDIPITPQTIFHSASLSKQFTAFAILLLEQEGQLSLTDDVRKYLPEVPDFGTTITLEHLASHRSGLRDQWRLLEMAGWRLDDVIKTEQIWNLVCHQEALNFTPGEKNSYSNTGFTLLAEVVARVSGQSFARFTQERIFEPLGMVNTQFYDDYEKIVKNRAYSYQGEGEELKKSVLSFSNVGPTSLFTTAEDMARWAMNFTQLKVGNQALIDQLNTAPALNNGNVNGYALGQFVGTFEGINLFFHSGSDAGYRAYFARIPDHDLAVVLLGNAASMSPLNQLVALLELYLHDYFSSEQESAKKEIFEPDPKTFISLSKQQLEPFTGQYFEAEEGYKRKLYLKGDTLMYYRSTSSESKLVPIAHNQFKMLGDTEDVTVVFNSGKNGEPKLDFYINDRAPIQMFRFTDVQLTDYPGVFYSRELMATYTLTIKGDQLVLQHPRREAIALEAIQKDLFTSKNRNYKKVEFIRDAKGQITS